VNYDNTDRGVLFKNDKQGNESRPDYRGTLNVNGQDFWISAWVKSSKAGNKYMSLSVQPKEAKAETERQSAAPASAAFDDDIPF
jgi:uncharacterized protein (DUF736 family)